jgi:hypothetical protein
MRKIVIAVVSVALTASTATADSVSLAAPGDCAQPIRDLDTGPVSALATAGAGVAGPAAIHFAPIAVAKDALAVLPLDLTRATGQTVDTADDAISDPDDATADLVDKTVNDVGGGDPVPDLPDVSSAPLVPDVQDLDVRNLTDGVLKR